MSTAFSQALILVITNLGGLYVGAILVRFLLQAARADFYNPICQVLVKVTAPLLNPLRRVIPGWCRLDIASLVLALVLSSLFTMLMVFSTGSWLPIGRMVSWALVGLISMTMDIYFWSMMVMVVASFIAPTSGHPILLLMYQLLQPFYKLSHRILPPMGGLDFTPLLLMLVIKVLEILVLNPLATGLRVAPSVVIGI